jgi:hypothetical protein
MATKKNVTETKANEIKEAKEAKVTVEDELVEVFIPIDYSNPEEMTQYVGVGGVSMLVPKGQKVKVKPHFAAEINRMLAETDAQFQKAEEQRLRDMNNNPGYVNSTY